MLMTFQLPLHFEDLACAAAKEWQVKPVREREASSDVLFDRLAENERATVSASVPPSPQFIAVYTLITRYASLTAQQRESLVKHLHAVCDRTFCDRTTPTGVTLVKQALFLTAGVVAAACTALSTCSFWEKKGRDLALEALIALVSQLEASPPFTPADLDQLASHLVRAVLFVLEHPASMKPKATRTQLATLLTTALTLHDRQALPASTALLHALARHEHIPVPLADILAIMHKANASSAAFVAQFVHDLCTNPSANLETDAGAAKSYSAFTIELAEKLPHVFRTKLALVIKQLDLNSYAIRNGVVHVIGVLIRAEPKPDDPLLDLLMQRSLCDITAFTRSKAMQVWISLVKTHAVPNDYYSKLATMAKSRLEDRAAAVRKYAAQLLVALLEQNPFGPVLKKSQMEPSLSHLLQSFPELDDSPEDGQLDQTEPQPEKEASTDVEDEMEDDNDDSLGVQENEDPNHTVSSTQENDKDTTNSGSPESLSKIELEQSSDNPETEEQKKARLKVSFYRSAIAFISAVEDGLDTVYNMLRSKSITDVQEAVSLLVVCVQFQLEQAAGRAVRKMLPLVLACDSNVQTRAIDAYVRLLAPAGVAAVEDKDPALAVALGLVELTVGATTGELDCIEELISSLSGEGENQRVISNAVITVLWDLFAGKIPNALGEQRRAACMLISMVTQKRAESLANKLDVLENVGLQDPTFARWSCAALSRLPAGHSESGRLCQQLAAIARSSSDLSTVEQAISAIFSLSEMPEKNVAKIIRELAGVFHENASKAHVLDLTRFFVIIGHVAVKELVRIEALVSQLKKAARSGTDENNEEEERMAAEIEDVVGIAEKELVSPNSLLGRYGYLAQRVACDGDGAPAELQAAAVLCLAKLMCVQEKFCEANLRVLFSIIKSSKHAMVRANAITSLGDLTFRFPNLVEPYTSRIYDSLKDEDVKVRKNTLMVLTHLILNDMIKVKGQMVGMAVSILDEDSRVVDLARLFFHELARKAPNAIFNILPDTLSCLLHRGDLSEDEFKKVASFLIALLSKEKHADVMAEKLCQRLRTCASDDESRKMSYCVCQLNISESGMKKLNEKGIEIQHGHVKYVNPDKGGDE